MKQDNLVPSFRPPQREDLMKILCSSKLQGPTLKIEQKGESGGYFKCSFLQFCDIGGSKRTK